jgi:hypothetical protein
MDDQEIKNLRHSFTTSKKEESTKVKKNQFGHTILGEESLIDVTNIKVALNNEGEIEANSDGWLESDELISKLSESLLVESQSPLTVQALLEPQKPSIQPHIEGRSIYTELMSELDDLANSNAGITKPKPSLGSNDFENTKTGWTNPNKSCLNKDCLYDLPKDAKFCLKCGTAQMPKFCTECGFQFPGMEKFCPDCGTKR